MTGNLYCLGCACAELQHPVAECCTEAQSVIFPISLIWEYALNAQLNATNSILMQLFLFSRFLKTE